MGFKIDDGGFLGFGVVFVVDEIDDFFVYVCVFLVIMWWLFLVDMVVVSGFWRLLCVFFFLFFVVISCGCG